MAHGTWNGDGQLAAGIDIAEENAGHRAAGLLAEVEALVDHRHVFLDAIDGDGPAVEEEDDDRLAQRGHPPDQLFLPADQIEAGAVAHVHERPCLARGLLVAADGQHDDIGLFGHLDRFGDRLGVLGGVAGGHLVLIPTAADGDLAALAIENVHAVSELLLDAVEHRHAVLGHTAVAAQ